MKNPIKDMSASKVGKLTLPSLDKEEVRTLLARLDNTRDKSIVALFTESGLRLSELVRVKQNDIDWDDGIVRVVGKGKNEAHAPFGELSRRYLEDWLRQYEPGGGGHLGF